MGIFLGLDSSTQSLSAMIIDTKAGSVVAQDSVNFGNDLPSYESPKGVLPSADPALAHADPLMWVEALDLLFVRLREAGCDLSRIDGISGAGQQHGSVYLNRSINELGGWAPERPLVEQVAPLLSRRTSPIWMDSSTRGECEEIARAIGGDAKIVTITGSRMTERFTGPQIRKFFKTESTAYAATREIHLVSSFVASLLTGRSAPIDFGDGAGMNLLDLQHGAWDPLLLDATAPGLASRLRSPSPSQTVVGDLAKYFTERYGFRAGIPVIAFTGDNPSSLIGMGASEPGTAVISLGTSDTVFAAMRQPRTDPRGYGHVFGNPAGGFMSLICFSNGSLAREAVAKRFNLDWPAFEAAITQATQPGNDGNYMLPFFVPEITPRISAPGVVLEGTERFMSWGDASAAARAIVEAQALSMRRHSDWIGDRLERILVTGGASRNRGLLRVLADVFQAEIRPLSVSNSSALGGALRAAQAVEKLAFADLYRVFAAPDADLVTRPNEGARPVYETLGGRFVERLESLIAAQSRA